MAAKLLLCDGTNGNGVFIQDRCRNFFAFPRVLSGQAGHYWGARANKELVAISGFFPYPTRDQLLCDFDVFYSTDSLVHPEHRGQLLFPYLIKSQCGYFRKLGKKTLLWGIENTPNTLSFLPSLLKKQGFEADLSLKTKFTEIYVSNYPPENIEGNFTDKLISSLSSKDILVQAEEAHRSRKNKFLSPAFREDFFERIVAMDPQAKRFSISLQNGENASCFAWSFSSVRKYRLQKEIASLQAKKQRLGFSQKVGDEVPVLVLSCLSYSSVNVLRVLLDKIYAYAFYSSFDLIVAHGIPDGALSRFLQLLTIESKLRVLLASSAENSSLLAHYRDSELDLDVGYL